MAKTIEEINEKKKAIIILYLDSNSYDEIAEITGISKTNVGTRLTRIKEELKKMAIKKQLLNHNATYCMKRAIL